VNANQYSPNAIVHYFSETLWANLVIY